MKQLLGTTAIVMGFMITPVLADNTQNCEPGSTCDINSADITKGDTDNSQNIGDNLNNTYAPDSANADASATIGDTIAQGGSGGHAEANGNELNNTNNNQSSANNDLRNQQFGNSNAVNHGNTMGDQSNTMGDMTNDVTNTNTAAGGSVVGSGNSTVNNTNTNAGGEANSMSDQTQGQSQGQVATGGNSNQGQSQGHAVTDSGNSASASQGNTTTTNVQANTYQKRQPVASAIAPAIMGGNWICGMGGASGSVQTSIIGIGGAKSTQSDSCLAQMMYSQGLIDDVTFLLTVCHDSPKMAMALKQRGIDCRK